MIQKCLTGLIGFLLLPAVAGLALALYPGLIDFQMEAESAQLLLRFFLGFAIQAVLFLCFPKAVRSYILAHELSHILAAWLSGVRAGQLRVSKEGGSVEVERSTFFIALSPYLIPFYSLLLISVHYVAHLWWDPQLWSAWLPLGLGFTWSFHLSFTLYALSVTQSDISPYGRLGAFSFILFGNLLLLCLALYWVNDRPAGEDLRHLLVHLKKSYVFSLTHLLENVKILKVD